MMDRRIIYCFSCNAKYDVSAVPADSRFLCKACQTTIKVPGEGDTPPIVDAEEEPIDLDVISEDLIIEPLDDESDIQGLSFTKMVGTGNDFVLVDGFREVVENPETTSKAMCDRRWGAGGDGLLLLLPSGESDVRMRMFNPDGSEAEACGNGLRCLVKYAFDHGHVSGRLVTVETAAGVRVAEVIRENEVVSAVRVGMGLPSTRPADIPVNVEGEDTHGVRIEAAGRTFEGTAVSMGNPHFVVFVDDVEGMDVHVAGPAIENHPLFPNRTNVEFVQVLSPGKVLQRTWERGAGETLACGSGACAVCVASAIHGRTERKIEVGLRGGDLKLDWSEAGEVFLEGPAKEVFTGLWCSS
ncbi:MAG: diaminopimelate epimerase [Planctomycetota bacterium]|jgi:diaminopimelate epimerase